MKYTTHKNKLVRIWFSNTPDTFMDMRNQLRLIRLREKHPLSSITLIYDKRLLDSDAIKALTAFCNKFNIIPLDLSESKDCFAKSDIEREIYQIAMDEVEDFKHNKGGNLAAASDACRVLSGVIELGIYSDFDCQVNLENKDISLERPIVLPIIAAVKDANKTHVSYATGWNADVIFFALKDGNLHPHAKSLLHDIHCEMIRNYKKQQSIRHPTLLYLTQAFGITESQRMVRDVRKVLEDVIKDQDLLKEKLPIFFIDENDSDPNSTKERKERLLSVLGEIYEELVTRTVGSINFVNVIKEESDFMSYAISSHPELKDAIHSTLNGNADLSWTPLRAAGHTQRNQKILDATTKIQQTIRRSRVN